jgi:protoporphyrinogen IX oxidase
MADTYLWAKAFHIIFSIAWMAGLLYLPRLFVYHCEAESGSKRSVMLKVMERRLVRAIMLPAIVAVFLSGAWLLFVPGVVDWSVGWIYVKLVLVVGLAGTHGLMVRWYRGFASDANKHPQRFYRVLNEVPTILMMGIVILVVVKPF